jgi:DnaJ family protein B protein 6
MYVYSLIDQLRPSNTPQGTEHITRTYPDGREVHTINGMEQPTSRGYIAQRSESPESHHRVHHGSSSQPHITGSRSAAPPYSPPTYSQGQPRANGYANPCESCMPHGCVFATH